MYIKDNYVGNFEKFLSFGHLRNLEFVVQPANNN